MPDYLYSHPETGKIVTIFQHMNDIHEYEENGIKFKRVWVNPNASFDSIAIDPYNPKDFARVTNKGGTLGDLYDRSAELSAIRESKDGVDTFKQKYFDDYKKKRKGKEHPEEKRIKSAKKMDDLGIKVSYE